MYTRKARTLYSLKEKNLCESLYTIVYREDHKPLFSQIIETKEIEKD